MSEQGKVDRRGFLRSLAGKGAVAAAAAGGASALLAQPAGAGGPDPVLLGTNNVSDTGLATRITSSAFEVDNPAAYGMRIAPDNGTVPMPPTTGTWTAGSTRVDTAGGSNDLWYCYADGAGANSGWYPLSLVPAFVPLAVPQRIYNSTTNGDGVIASGQQRTIDSTAGNFVPITAFAVLMNLAVINTAGNPGYLAAFPAGQPWPGTSTINWFGSNQVLANECTCGTDNNGDFTILCGGSFSSANFVVDVVGYYTLTA